MIVHDWTASDDLPPRQVACPPPGGAAGDDSTRAPARFPIVGIGASARGIAAFEAFFSALPQTPAQPSRDTRARRALHERRAPCLLRAAVNSNDPAAATDPPAVAATGYATFTRDIVVLGTSAGGVETLQRLMATLPEDFPGAILVVVHISAEVKSELAAILSRAGPLPAVRAEDGMPITPGRIYVAPSDKHLLVEPDFMRVVRGPPENRHRPAIDPLFRSAAWAYGPRVVGVVLSGALDDGTAGLWAVKSCGGTTVVQEPNEALYPEMPGNALLHNHVDYRLLVNDIGPLLAHLARVPVEARIPLRAPATIRQEIEFARLAAPPMDAPRLGALSPFTCPSCRGALWEIDEGKHLRYRCHTGHAFSQQTLLLEQGSAAEESLYVSLRAVQEKAAALRRLAQRWPDAPSIAEDYMRRTDQLDAAANMLLGLLAGEPL